MLKVFKGFQFLLNFLTVFYMFLKVFKDFFDFGCNFRVFNGF